MKTLLITVVLVAFTITGCAGHVSKQGVFFSLAQAEATRDGVTVKSTITEHFYKFAAELVKLGVGIVRFITPAGLSSLDRTPHEGDLIPVRHQTNPRGAVEHWTPTGLYHRDSYDEYGNHVLLL